MSELGAATGRGIEHHHRKLGAGGRPLARSGSKEAAEDRKAVGGAPANEDGVVVVQVADEEAAACLRAVRDIVAFAPPVLDRAMAAREHTVEGVCLAAR